MSNSERPNWLSLDKIRQGQKPKNCYSYVRLESGKKNPHPKTFGAITPELWCTVWRCCVWKAVWSDRQCVHECVCTHMRFRVSKWKCFHFCLNMGLSFSFNVPTTWLFQNYTTSDGYEALSVIIVSQGPWVMINKMNKSPRCEGLYHGSVNLLTRFLEAPKALEERGCGIVWMFVCRTLWIIVQLQCFLLLQQKQQCHSSLEV